ncbi:MAG: response regulator [Fimbriimonadaceae bacterium]|nr:response regulator [Fimbriimonadaceae bacterium]
MNQPATSQLVYVVNADPGQLAAQTGLLSQAGLAVRGYASAAAAVADLDATDPPGLVITDLTLAGLDGWQLCRLLRSPEYAPFNAVPLLVVSATFSGDPERLAAEVGAAAFLPAPVDGAVLVAKARALLRGEPSRPSPRALLVVADPAQVAPLQQALAADGYQVGAAHTRPDALAALTATPYELALVAAELPAGATAEVIEDCRAQRPDCVVLLLAANPTPQAALAWLERGAAAWFRWPGDPAQLCELAAQTRHEQALRRSADLLAARTRALRESEEHHRTLVDGLPDIIMSFDRDGRHWFVSQNISEVLDLEAAQFIGLTHAELGFPEEQCRFWEDAIRRPFESGRTYETEIIVQGKHGPVYYDWRLVPERDSQGEVTKVIAIARDITARKQAEEEARRERANRELIGRIATAAIRTDDLARFQDHLLRLLGEAMDVSRTYVFTHGPEQHTMSNTAEWTAPGVTAQIANLQGIATDSLPWWHDQVLRGDVIGVDDIASIPDPALVALLQAQDIRAVLAMPLFIGTRYCGFLGCDECRDRREWTARERDLLSEAARILMGVWADEDLRQSERRFKGILQNVPTVAARGYTLDGTVCYWNRAAETFYGYTAEEALGRNLLDLLVPAANRAEVAAAIRSMAAAGEARPAAEMLLQRQDGSLIPVYSSHALVRLPGREPELFCIDVDLTEQKRNETERAQLQAQFAQSQKMESVGRLAGGIAHDFNNMLGAILGNTELALAQVPAGEPLHTELRDIQSAAERSAELTRQLLAFARKQTVAPRVLDLNATVESMLKLLRRLIGEDIALLWKPGLAVWPVEVDPAQTDQILANLCVNARDAISGTGAVTIATSNVTLPEQAGVGRAALGPGDYVLLTVSDDGCGMDAETTAHLFEPFFTTKEFGKGTGLGLASVYGAVQQNHGRIDVTSTPGHGTTFRIYLPRHTAAAPAPEDAASPTAAAGSETILVVEDEPAVLRMTTMMLELLGYRVLAADSPSAAIALAAAHHGPLDLLLTDVVMPEMNGRELADALQVSRPGLRRLFMSGYTADVIARQGVLDASTHFLAKPFSLHSLGTMVREALGADPA